VAGDLSPITVDQPIGPDRRPVVCFAEALLGEAAGLFWLLAASGELLHLSIKAMD
jgi:hypothetical protein